MFRVKSGEMLNLGRASLEDGSSGKCFVGRPASRLKNSKDPYYGDPKYGDICRDVSCGITGILVELKPPEPTGVEESCC